MQYTANVFLFFLNQNNERREMMQFHYLDWPHSGVPRHEEEMLRLIKIVKEYSAANGVRHIVVHCRLEKIIHKRDLSLNLIKRDC